MLSTITRGAFIRIDSCGCYWLGFRLELEGEMEMVRQIAFWAVVACSIYI